MGQLVMVLDRRGVISDKEGNFVAAFSAYYGNGTNMKGEIMALFNVFQLCTEMGLISVEVEADSLVTVKALKGLIRMPWEHECMLRKSKRLC